MGYRSNKQGVLSGVEQVLAKALFQTAADIVTLANLKAPVETGQLKQSGRVVPKSPLVIAVQFSRSSDRGYNVAARMEFDERIKHPGGGQAHYLQESVEKIAPKMPEYVQRFTVK